MHQGIQQWIKQHKKYLNAYIIHLSNEIQDTAKDRQMT